MNFRKVNNVEIMKYISYLNRSKTFSSRTSSAIGRGYKVKNGYKVINFGRNWVNAKGPCSTPFPTALYLSSTFHRQLFGPLTERVHLERMQESPAYVTRGELAFDITAR